MARKTVKAQIRRASAQITTPLALAGMLLTSALTAPHDAAANPLVADANPITGGITLDEIDSKKLEVTQTGAKGIIDWQTISNEPGDIIEFIHETGETGITLNRVVGASVDPTKIQGSINANGKIVIVDPNGIFITDSGHIDVASFVATTADVSNADFLASTGVLEFSTAGGATSSIVNSGTISVDSEGLAVLVAPGVRNSGVITATSGTVALASGNTFVVDFNGDGLVQFDPGVADVRGNVVSSPFAFGPGSEVDVTPIDAETGEEMPNRVLNDNDGNITTGGIGQFLGTLEPNNPQTPRSGGTVIMAASTASAILDSVVNDGAIRAKYLIVDPDGTVFAAADTGGGDTGGGDTGGGDTGGGDTGGGDTGGGDTGGGDTGGGDTGGGDTGGGDTGGGDTGGGDTGGGDTGGGDTGGGDTGGGDTGGGDTGGGDTGGGDTGGGDTGGGDTGGGDTGGGDTGGGDAGGGDTGGTGGTGAPVATPAAINEPGFAPQNDNRPVSSLADQTINQDLSFEPYEVDTLDVNLSLLGDGAGSGLANASPSALGELAPAGGGVAGNNSDCANAYLGNQWENTENDDECGNALNQAQ